MARQYCGQLGKEDNCQVAVSLSIANHHASLPVAYRLYLPQDWAKDRERRRKAGIPQEIGFQTKPEIALDQLRFACAAGLPRGVVLMDAGYGNNSDSRNLPYPTVTDPEEPPLRPERHIPNSIATVRRRLIVALVRTLSRCPCCAVPIQTPPGHSRS